VRLPSLLVPYPTAADNHQFYNARAFEATGAARLLEQKNATPEKVAALLCELIEGPAARAKIQAALAQWHAPKAAEQIAEIILEAVARCQKEVAGQSHPSTCSCGCADKSTKQAVSLGA
jgi:UDP-N-acetylglucosamine--N-acetylmuramyl-(pentapeptide) pyrophosphoryl-undecaprenol N-acetylglucosamine transferase